MNDDPSNTSLSESTPQHSSDPPLDAQLLIDFMRNSAARPLSAQSLQEQMQVTDARRQEFAQFLSSLHQQGLLVQTRDGRYGIPEKMNLVVGRLSCHTDGYGFVVPRGDPDQKDLYVPGRKLGNAMHGDLVIARLEHVRRSGRAEGRIIRILDRCRKQVVGSFVRSQHFGYVVPHDRKLVYDVYIPEAEINGAEPGKVVCASITAYPEGSRNPEGRIVEVLGDIDDPRIDVEIVIREHELPHEFPDEVVREAEQLATAVREEDLAGRTDFRHLPVVTIDGEKARDFDDAVHVERLPNGNYKLGIHIADVAAYIPVGSAIDQEAQRRATSVYFPDKVVPMLPERLSNEICSLKPGVDRLVQSVIVEISSTGSTVNYEFHDGVIHSAQRMTYTEVAKLLDGSDERLASRYADYIEQVTLMSKLCETLRKYRGRRGSIDFDLPEPEILINLRGEVEGILRSERNQAHRIIEEFMIRANEVVASHLTWEGTPTLYRVHDGPDSERVEQFREFIQGLGLHLGGGSDPKPQHFQKLVEQLEGEQCERVIVYLMLRTMKQARYEAENNGHFGLASEMYTHFTSPIRRYPDLVVHRLLKLERGSVLQAKFEVETVEESLPRIGAESSQRERNAEDAERQYIDWKKVQFMADKVGESFEAYITGVHAYGFFIELEQFFVEGLVHVSSLDDDYYQFEERKHRLRGENKGRAFTLGDRVLVQLVRVDRTRRRLDFALEQGPLEVILKKKTAKPLASKKRVAKKTAPAKKRRRRKKSAGSKADEEQAKQAEATPSRTPGRSRRRQADGEPSKDQRPQRRKKAPASRKAKSKAKPEAAAHKKKATKKRSGRKRSAARVQAPVSKEDAKKVVEKAGKDAAPRRVNPYLTDL
ncbi:MAG: ribonuclease R [Acidobacteriota bacterium]